MGQVKENALTFALIIAILTSAFAGAEFTSLVSANPDCSVPTLAMPTEWVNYTIREINGTLWAAVDGNYPITILNPENSSELPMVYPMPPGTTDIHLYLAGKELSWSNFTQTYPDQTHHTAIGDWWMIYSLIGPISDSFELKIHYMHPIQEINGSYFLLYDLNIAPYLTKQGDNSTVYYTVSLPTNITNLHAYTTETDTQWNPISYTTAKDDAIQTIFIEECSEYSKLPGDLVVTFNNSYSIPELSALAVVMIILTLSVATLFCFKSNRLNS